MRIFLVKTTQEFNKLTADNFAARLTQTNLLIKTDFDKKLISFDKKIISNKTKYLEVQKKLNRLTTKDQIFFEGRIYFTSIDGFFKHVCLSTNTRYFELKKYKGTDYVLSWKSRRVSNSELKPLYTDFWHSIKLSEYRIGIKFDKYTLAVEQKNYTRKQNPTNNFKFINCLFRVTSVVKNGDKEKYVCSGYRITFDIAGSWSFDNDIARNVIIFGVDDSSSSHSNNNKNNFLVLGEGATLELVEDLVQQKKKLVLILVKQTQLCLSLNYNVDNSYLFVNGK